MIGGFACDLLMNDAGLDFRRTVDIDMVLTVEALTADFAKFFWLFIEAGGYRARQRSNGKPEFYRFIDPTNPVYPKMIELFSRPQSNVVLQPDTHLMPLHIDDEVSSLSAILLGDDYYRFFLDGRTVTDGISILDAEHIILLKMKAWLDLKSKKAEGIHVNSRDIKKHRLDVFRLFQLVRDGQKITVPKSVGEDITQFIAQMREMEIRLTDIGINRPKDSILDIYSNMYITE
ncbi:MAG: hypothetical protein HFI65_03310 [Lachnospiraceae bacterium]|nr:hypothetical protein [Lachnospiraceae bacterium]